MYNSYFKLYFRVLHKNILLSWLTLHLKHALDHGVDFFHSVTRITTFVEVSKLFLVSTTRGRQFEWPHEVIGFLEGWANSVQFVDNIFNASDAFGAKGLLNDAVIGQSYALLVDFSVTTFVYQGPAETITVWTGGLPKDPQVHHWGSGYDGEASHQALGQPTGSRGIIIRSG